MSRILVAYAMKMGSTREIAETVGDALTSAGEDVTVLPAQDVLDVGYYDAVVLGSALYMSRWRPDAVQFLRRFRGELTGKRVWLFHSGPLGEGSDKPQKAPAAVRRLVIAIGAPEPYTFGGRIEPATAKGFMAKGPMAGDYRDWAEVHDWAGTITRSLHEQADRRPRGAVAAWVGGRADDLAYALTGPGLSARSDRGVPA